MPWSIYILALIITSFTHMFLMERTDTYSAKYSVTKNGHAKYLTGRLITTKQGKPNKKQLLALVKSDYDNVVFDVEVISLDRVHRVWSFLL